MPDLPLDIGECPTGPRARPRHNLIVQLGLATEELNRRWYQTNTGQVLLQGLESEQAARDIGALLRRFEIVSMAGDAIAVAGARNFRFLRRRGITVRKTIDLLIGTWCIENRASLLHNDSDFHPMTRYLGLREFIGRER